MAQVCRGGLLWHRSVVEVYYGAGLSWRSAMAQVCRELRTELPIIFWWCRPPKALKNVGKTLSAGADAVLRAKTSVTRQASWLAHRLAPKQARLATRW
jgi:hypothetical protein